MNVELETSYRYCETLARRSASSFYGSFWFLPRAKRRAMCVLYAFSRLTDDLGDCDREISAKREALRDWQAEFERALQGEENATLWPALRHVVEQYNLSPTDLRDIVSGVAMDLEPCRYETFEQLQVYCHRVASAVGLACLAIWGYRDPAALELARPCGVAMQLTNILRDLREDARRDRLYLPLEDLRRFGYSFRELSEGRDNRAFRELMRFEIERVEQLFAASQPILGYLQDDGQRTCSLIIARYRAILAEIKRHPDRVFLGRVRLPWHRKLTVLLHSMFTRLPADASAATNRCGVAGD
jgi:phytoene synthase